MAKRSRKEWLTEKQKVISRCASFENYARKMAELAQVHQTPLLISCRYRFSQRSLLSTTGAAYSKTGETEKSDRYKILGVFDRLNEQMGRVPVATTRSVLKGFNLFYTLRAESLIDVTETLLVCPGKGTLSSPNETGSVKALGGRIDRPSVRWYIFFKKAMGVIRLAMSDRAEERISKSNGGTVSMSQPSHIEKPLPDNEAARLDALHRYAILDTAPEGAFDDITLLASHICGAPIALISLVDADRQWFKSKVGVSAPETPRDISFCAYAILQSDLLIVPDALTDQRFATNPLVVSDPCIRFYAGAPLVTPEGFALGTLCIIDRVPRELSSEQRNALQALSRQVVAQLELRHQLAERRRAEEEIGRLNEALEHRVVERTAQLKATNQKLKNEIVERERAEETIRHQAYYDPLTDLPNRILFRDRLRQAILTGRREGKPLALLLLDLDRFKEINDTLGHQNGDRLLQQVGPRLRTVLRESDTVARLGGDEFAALLPSADKEGAILAASKILKSLEVSFVLEGLTLDVEASIGIALYPDHGKEADLLIRKADVAMYLAKQARAGHAVYASEQDQYSPRRLTLIGDLRQAMSENQLFLLYQPKVSLRTGCIIGTEALVRWRHPTFGIIPPDQFILPAEQTGLIKPLTLWVLDTALRQCLAWRQAGLEIGVAVNLSARNLQDLILPDQVAELLRAHGLAADRLQLEITESTLMADPVNALKILNRLDGMGVRFSIDDFGTGYSSLGYLKKLPVVEIKIDKSFVFDMAANDDDTVIVRSTIELAHNLGLTVVAEGVENQETMDKLSSLGCDAAQGYYISRPISGPELIRWLSETAHLKGWTVYRPESGIHGVQS